MMDGSMQGLTLPLREGPAWPGSQPAAGTARPLSRSRAHPDQRRDL